MLVSLAFCLALPFMSGPADAAEPGGAKPFTLPGCDGECSADQQIGKERTVIDTVNCKPNNPNMDQIGTCQKFKCANGFYYRFSGWMSVICVDYTVTQSNPICPQGTCEPAP